MKRNLSKGISIILLVLFTCAFTVQNLAAVTRNFKIELSTLFSGKHFKTLPVAPDCPVDEESLCEEENEDETETQFNPLALLAIVCSEIFAIESHTSYRNVSIDDGERPDTPQPLYLVTGTFRI